MKRLFNRNTILIIALIFGIITLVSCTHEPTTDISIPTSTPTASPDPTPTPLDINQVKGKDFNLPFYSDTYGKNLDYILASVDMQNTAELNVIALDNYNIAVSSVGYSMSNVGAKSYCKVDIFDLRTGQMVGSKLFDSSVVHLFVDDGLLSAFDSSTGIFHKFSDYTLVNSLTYDLSQNLPTTMGYDGLSYLTEGCAYMNNNIYYISGNNLLSINLETRDVRTLITADTNGASCYGFIKNSASGKAFSATFSIYGLTTEYIEYVVDFSENVEKIYTGGQAIYFGKNDAVMSYSYKYNTLTKYIDTSTFTLSLRDGEYVSTAIDDYLISSIYDYNSNKTTFNVYEISSGSLLFSHQLGDPTLLSVAIMPERSVLLFVDSNFGIYAVPFYPDKVSPGNENVLETKLEKLATKEENLATASRLNQKYGIVLGLYEEGVRPFDDFSAVAIYDHRTIRTALETIESSLDMLPAGFIQELTSFGDLTNLHILLAGQLIQGSSTGTSNPVAFAVSDYTQKAKVLVLNIEDENLKRTIIHELMHYVEDQILYAKAHFDRGNGLLDWGKLNPVSFSYNFSYVDSNGNDYSNSEYTYGYVSPDNTYFVDTYSKTFPWEDRARILEYLICGDAASAEYFRIYNINVKANYLVDSIKSVFSTWQNVDEMDWYGKISAN